jgi:hypothetical protein
MNTPLSLNFLNRNPRMTDEPADFTVNEKVIPQTKRQYCPLSPGKAHWPVDRPIFRTLERVRFRRRSWSRLVWNELSRLSSQSTANQVIREKAQNQSCELAARGGNFVYHQAGHPVGF